MKKQNKTSERGIVKTHQAVSLKLQTVERLYKFKENFTESFDVVINRLIDRAKKKR